MYPLFRQQSISDLTFIGTFVPIPFLFIPEHAHKILKHTYNGLTMYNST